MHMWCDKWVRWAMRDSRVGAEDFWGNFKSFTLLDFSLFSIKTLTCLSKYFFNRVKTTDGDQSKLCQNPKAAGPWSHRHNGAFIQEAAEAGTSTQRLAEPAYFVLHFVSIACMYMDIYLLWCDYHSSFLILCCLFKTLLPFTVYVEQHLMPQIYSWKGSKTRQRDASKITMWSIFSSRKKRRKLLVTTEK